MFLGHAEFKARVRAEPFFGRMSPADLRARKSASAHEYINAYVRAYRSFSQEERDSIARTVRELPALGALPWRFAKVAAGIEGDHPHTIRDTIVLPTRYAETGVKRRTTFIHEQIHVFQKAFPERCRKYLETLGYRPVETMTGMRERGHLVRNNPDVDDYIYHHDSDKLPIACVYRSRAPHDVSDVTALNESRHRDHPLEIMAYDLSQIL
jgi:hypothetical protein